MKNEKTQEKTKIAATVETDHDVCPAIPDASHIQEQDKSSGDESEDIPLAVVLKHPQRSRRCAGNECGKLLDPTLPRLDCAQCGSRKLGSRRKTGQHRGPRASVKSPVSSAYPEYKCPSALLSEFKSRLTTFLEAQSYYALSKLAQGANHTNDVTVFGFDGEFSVVAADFDILGKKEEMAENALKLKGEIESFSGLHFREICSSTHQGGIIRRFTCLHEVPSFTSSSVSPSWGVEAPSKTMQGELEVAFFADHSHRFFCGAKNYRAVLPGWVMMITSAYFWLNLLYYNIILGI